VSLREAATRVFSNASGSYSSNVNLAVENSSWSDEQQLQEMYLKRKSFAFNSDRCGEQLLVSLPVKVAGTNAYHGVELLVIVSVYENCIYRGNLKGNQMSPALIGWYLQLLKGDAEDIWWSCQAGCWRRGQ
jgi:hypothetical protein